MLLKNFKTVEGGIVHLRINDGKSAFVENPVTDFSEQVIDGKGQLYLSPGWVDIHTHCFHKWKLYGDRIDEVGYKHGVTTVVDAGTTGSDHFAELVEQIKQAKTKAYALLNVSRKGIEHQDELSCLKWIDQDSIGETLKKYRSFVLGLKVRMSRSVVKDSGDIPLALALQLADHFNLPLMVHIGNPPSLIETVLKTVRKGDIITHIMNPKKNGILDQDGQIKQAVWQAHARGVVFDLGHGTDSFSYQTCRQAYLAGLKCDTISTDIYFHNRLSGPVYSLGDILSKMLACGYNLKEVIDMVTCRPRQVLALPEAPLDWTIFELRQEAITLPDSTRKEETLPMRIVPRAVLLDGQYYDLEDD